MKLSVKGSDGSDQGELQVGFAVVDNAKGTQAVHEVVTAYRAAQRRGTAHTKTRAEVSGTGKKPWRQKGTGRARVGSRRNPIWRGGGVAHGPRMRDYTKKVGKKTRRLALRKALSARMHDGDVLVVDTIKLPGKAEANRPRLTRRFSDLLGNLDISDKASVLVVVGDASNEVILGARNLKDVELARGVDVNTYQVLKYDKILIARDGLDQVTHRLQ